MYQFGSPGWDDGSLDADLEDASSSPRLAIRADERTRYSPKRRWTPTWRRTAAILRRLFFGVPSMAAVVVLASDRLSDGVLRSAHRGADALLKSFDGRVLRLNRHPNATGNYL